MARMKDKIISRCPSVIIRRFGPRKSAVDYDMYNACERMSSEALRPLVNFVRRYHEAHTPPAKRKRLYWVCDPTAGYIQVLPEHAEEFAGRVLVHITDLVNLDPEQHAQVVAEDMETTAEELQGPLAWPRFEEHIRMIRKEVEAAYPDLLDDPLGHIPGVPTAGQR